MPRLRPLALLGVVVLLLAAPVARAQSEATGQSFVSVEALRDALSVHMEAGDLEGAMTRFAPPALRSVGRLRVLAERVVALSPLEGPATLLREAAPEGRREVLAWWAGEVHVYVYIFALERPDGVRVLDFRMSGDIREAVGWW